MHISEQIAAELVSQGFEIEAGSEGRCFRKALPTGGAFGSAVTRLELCERGRWLDRQDGWGHMEREIDLRNFSNDPTGAIKAVLS